MFMSMKKENQKKKLTCSTEGGRSGAEWAFIGYWHHPHRRRTGGQSSSWALSGGWFIMTRRSEVAPRTQLYKMKKVRDGWKHNQDPAKSEGCACSIVPKKSFKPMCQVDHGLSLPHVCVRIYKQCVSACFWLDDGVINHTFFAARIESSPLSMSDRSQDRSYDHTNYPPPSLNPRT